MNLGVTGTRHGMTDHQKGAFADLLVRLHDTGRRPQVFRHGGCQGADVEAARIVREMYGNGVSIVCHPGPDGDPHQTPSGVDDERLPGKTHFARNRDIVDATDVLVACPCDMTQQTRGGTWYTVVYAYRKRKPVWIVWPDGTMKEPTDAQA